MSRNELHNRLFQIVCEEITDEEFKSLCEASSRWIVPAKRQHLKQTRELLNQLQRQGVIKINDYTQLFKLLKDHKLIEVLSKVKDVAKEIENASDTDDEDCEEEPPKKKASIGRQFDIINRTQSVEDDSPLQYSTEKMGLVLIVNNMKFDSSSYTFRQGSEKDEENIRKVFGDKLAGRYRVLSGDRYRNCTQQQFRDILLETQEFLRSGIYDQFLCFIFSHGEQRGILMRDGTFVHPDDIIRCFKADQIEEMAAHPKVFIFQACRGGSRQQGIKIDGSECPPSENDLYIETDTVETVVPVDANIVTGYSTTKGFVSFRNIFTGSWYIECICDIFSQNYCSEHLLDLLTRVHYKVASRTTQGENGVVNKQMPSFDSSFMKKMYLHY